MKGRTKLPLVTLIVFLVNTWWLIAVCGFSPVALLIILVVTSLPGAAIFMKILDIRERKVRSDIVARHDDRIHAAFERFMSQTCQKWKDPYDPRCRADVFAWYRDRFISSYSYRRLKFRWPARLEPISALKYFRWVCSRESREAIDLAVSDLKKDKREMLAKRLPRWFIQIVIGWHVARTIIAFSWDSVRTVFGKVAPLLSTFARRE